VIRPRDISTDNKISYDKIAEARVSYGGRGPVVQIQKPAYGQQILDILSPF
jgi:flagellar L-ring protein precursor FlgH